MKRGGALSALLFRAVVGGFAALLLVLSLFWRIALIEKENEILTLEKAIAAAEEESGRLDVRLESAVSLEELEAVAVTKLGMQHPAPGQIVVMDALG